MAKTTSTTPSVGNSEPTSIQPVGSSDPMAEAGHDAAESIGHLTERATDLGYRQADVRREQVASSLEELAGGIRRVSSNLEGQQPAVANIAQTAAQQTDRVARYLQETDARQLVSNVEDLARRQPLLFLGGAFLLGMAASRLLKAGTAPSSDTTGNGYRAGYGGAYRATGPGRSASRAGIQGEGI